MHEQFAALATRLINANGRAMNLLDVINTGNEYDPRPVEQVTEVIGVQTRYAAEEISGDLVLATDKKYLFDSKKPITADMRIEDNGVSHSIVSVVEIKPGETSCLYKVQARV